MAELHEGVEGLRKLQAKPTPIINGKAKGSIITLMAAMAGDVVSYLNASSIVVLDAFFGVGPVFSLLRGILDAKGDRLVHVITRAKNNAVAYEDPPPPTGRQGRPPTYGTKLALMYLFEERLGSF